MHVSGALSERQLLARVFVSHLGGEARSALQRHVLTSHSSPVLCLLCLHLSNHLSKTSLNSVDEMFLEKATFNFHISLLNAFLLESLLRRKRGCFYLHDSFFLNWAKPGIRWHFLPPLFCHTCYMAWPLSRGIRKYSVYIQEENEINGCYTSLLIQ